MTAESIRTGLQAWLRGDASALAAVLAPDVELRAFGSGQWDCSGRADVLDLLTQHPEHPPGAARIHQVDDHDFLLSWTTEPQERAEPVESSGPFVRITTSGDRVTRIQQYPTRADAVHGNTAAEEAAIGAVRSGDLAALSQLLRDHPDLATARLLGHGDRTLLHVATDWPGHFPGVAATIETLVRAGADVDAPSIGDHTETALHWAASSDDLEALDALLDAGADIEARGAVIGGGTPLSDATAFGCWAAARRLVERGAQPTMWEAASLGLMGRLQSHYQSSEPTAEETTNAFWSSCHGNQAAAAAYLLERGADINWVGYDDLTPLEAAQRSGATDLLVWLRDHGAVTRAEKVTG
jgi:ketosteroid isomerase-like protein